MAVDKRILFGSLAAAVVISIGGGYALSRDHDSTDATRIDDDITISSDASMSEPGLANALVEGQHLPSVALIDLDGNTISTDDLIGQPLVINLWATNCVACKDEMPALAKVHREFGDSVRFVGVNAYRNSDEAIAFARDKGVNYELVSDQDGHLAAALQVTALPYTLFVASDGTIVAQKGIALTAAEIRAAVVQNLLS